jgi:hypothetical protein
LSDLLGDLMHWCDRSGFDFGDELAGATGITTPKPTVKDQQSAYD